MAKVNPDLLAWNRGIVSPLALARVDVERTRLSAETMTNWIPKTQGAMRIRPGLRYLGSSKSDQKAAWIEFVASTDDTALVELTDSLMRVWIDDELLARDTGVDTPVAGLTDSGAWTDASSGGSTSGTPTDMIPDMTASTTSGVTVTANSDNAVAAPYYGRAWNAADDDNTSLWGDTGSNTISSLPSYLQVDFGAGNSKTAATYTVRAGPNGADTSKAPRSWLLYGNHHDTGAFPASWTFLDSGGDQTAWAAGEKRSFTIGSPSGYRVYRFYVTEGNGSAQLTVSEFELIPGATSGKLTFSGGALTLNAGVVGGVAKARQAVTCDTGNRDIEHGLAIHVTRGPVMLRVGSTAGNDDYIEETALGTGYHSLAFTPESDFVIEFQTDQVVDRIVGSVSLEAGGTVEIVGPWTDTGQLDDVRYDQSADVIYVDSVGQRPRKIERRGTGRSWSVVEYAPDHGPFLPFRSSSAKVRVGATYGNTTLTSNIPFFRPEHVGAIFRLFHDGQSGEWRMGAEDTVTDAIEVTGISDTGTPGSNSERRVAISGSGTWSGRVTTQRSFDGPDIGFHDTDFSDTGSFSRNIDDPDDNLIVWYRFKIKPGDYNSGTLTLSVTYKNGGKTGIVRVTNYQSNTVVNVEVLSRFSSTAYSDNWQEGYWSDAQSFPSAVAFHEGRLFHAGGANIFGSVSDDFENFDDETEGDAGPIIKTLGRGPVDVAFYLMPLLRLIVGTAGAEISLRASSTDEVLTPTNNSAKPISTQGSANLRSLVVDSRGIFVQRSGKRVFSISFGESVASLSDYESRELTLLVPDLLDAGIVSVAVQRQPDTRLHFALADGRVAILTYEVTEEVLCWSVFETDGVVEKVMTLPGTDEDQVYYHVRRDLPRGNDAYTKVMLHFDGPDESIVIADANYGGAEHAWTTTGNAQIDTAASRFDGSSLLLDGSGDYISTPASSDVVLGSGDWTVDFWFNCTQAASTRRALIGQCNAGGTAAATSFRIYRDTDNALLAFVCVGSTAYSVDGTTQFTDALNTGWHHCAFVRTGSVLKLFVDGVQEGASTAITGTVNTSAELLTVGTDNAGGSDTWTGWIDEVRISVGIARWTATFTPPVHSYRRTVRFLERWATESEAGGGVPSWIADAAVNVTDTGGMTTVSGLSHLAGKQVTVWANDTGQSDYGMDMTPDDTGGTQQLYTVDTGAGTITLPVAKRNVVVGLPYSADYKSTKLAYGAQMGTALAQWKRVEKIAFILANTHNNGLFRGSDTGRLDPLPRMTADGAEVDDDRIFESFDQAAMSFNGKFDTDSRIVLRGKAPRPVTVMAAVPTITTNER